jgi:hypothetical protein
VGGGAYNYLGREALHRALAAVPWQHPDNVVVLIAEEDDRRFQVWAYMAGDADRPPRRQPPGLKAWRVHLSAQGSFREHWPRRDLRRTTGC